MMGLESDVTHVWKWSEITFWRRVWDCRVCSSFHWWISQKCWHFWHSEEPAALRLLLNLCHINTRGKDQAALRGVWEIRARHCENCFLCFKNCNVEMMCSLVLIVKSGSALTHGKHLVFFRFSSVTLCLFSKCCWCLKIHSEMFCNTSTSNSICWTSLT